MIHDKRDLIACTFATFGLAIAFYAAMLVDPIGFIGHVWSMFP